MSLARDTMNTEDWIKLYLVPGRMYLNYKVKKELRKGEKELRLLPFLVHRQRSAVDVGANKGVWTHLLAGLCVHVHAFEPHPKQFQYLKRALPRNATAYDLALSDKEGEAVLRLRKGRHGPVNLGGTLADTNVTGDYVSIPVKTQTLDALGLQNVGFMKIDVEGFEMTVLRGAAKTIARDKPVIIMEIAEEHTRAPALEGLQTVEAMGYEGFVIAHGQMTRALKADPRHFKRGATEPKDFVQNFIFLPR